MALHVRIDDRLLHGQVTLGWVPVLRPALIVVADDRAAADEWEREAYLASEPEDAEVVVLDLAGAAARAADAEKRAVVLLLVRGPVEFLRLVELGLPVHEAVVGGLHAGAGRARFADDLQISAREARAFSTLTRRGVRCYYQPLPANHQEPLPDLTRIMEEERRA